MIRKNLQNYSHQKFSNSFIFDSLQNISKPSSGFWLVCGRYFVQNIFEDTLGYYCALSFMAGYEEVYYSTKIAVEGQITVIKKGLSLSIAVHKLSRLMLGIGFHNG